MATASCIDPSDEKAYYLKWLSLLVDGSTLVLKNQFDQIIPPSSLQKELNRLKNFKKITTLIKRKALNKQQQAQLFPPNNGQPDSSTFDVSLLVCLLRSVCGLKSDQDPVWSAVPSPTDTSTEADITRLRNLRNEVSHQAAATTMTATEFVDKWNDLEKILMRLGKNIPDLGKHMNILKNGSIDPANEKTYEDRLKVWEDMDKLSQEQIQDVKEKLQSTAIEIDALTGNVDTLGSRVEKVETAFDEQKEDKLTLDNHEHKLSSFEADILEDREKIEILQVASADHELQIEKIKKSVTESEAKQSGLIQAVKQENTILQQQVTEIKNTHGETDRTDHLARLAKRKKVEEEWRESQKKSMSSKFKSLASISKDYFEEASTNSVYVKTKAFDDAKKKLYENKRFLIISGHPGEGKTSLATQLALNVSSADQCLKLRSPSDWKHIDFSLHLFDCVVIDDIFGANVLSEISLSEWENHLPDISRMAGRGIRVIITTRHYILEEAKDKLENWTFFKKDHLYILSSSNLVESERVEILKSHLRKSDRQCNDDFVQECVIESNQFLDSFRLQENKFIFGFPECVDMFVNNDELFNRGALFFQKPIEFFHRCVSGLFKDEEKFLALAMIWARNEEKPLSLTELDLSSTAHEVQRIAKMFGFKLKTRLIKKLRRSLSYHESGFIEFDSKTGSYNFSHNVISDMVGLVLGKNYPKETIQLSTRDFAMEYISVEANDSDGYLLYVKEYMYGILNEKICSLLFRPSRPDATDFTTMQQLRRRGFITLFNTFDVSVIFHKIFNNTIFVNCFVQHVIDKHFVDKLVHTRVMNVTGWMFSYGIKIRSNFCLPTISLLSGNGTLFMELMRRNLLGKDQSVSPSNSDLTLSLLVAIHSGQTLVVEGILKHGIEITEEAIYIAVHRESTEILNILLKSRQSLNSTISIHYKNNALVMSAKKGLKHSVRCLIDNGVELDFRNDDNLSALDKAVLYMHYDVCKLLLENGANPNLKTGKYKRTPLHVAADTGQNKITELLLNHGAKVDKKDHRGHFPIHCATFSGHAEIVSTLIRHNATHANAKITSYGKKSSLKGMTIAHIAAQKGHKEIIDVLLKENIEVNTVDHYGRTPFYCAVYHGKYDIVKKLLNSTDVNRPDKDGYMPLHAAIHRGHYFVANILLPLADVNAVDKYGRTVCHVASEQANLTILVTLIRDFNADMRAITKRGDTIFHILYRQYCQDCFRKYMWRQIRNKKIPNLSLLVTGIEVMLAVVCKGQKMFQFGKKLKHVIDTDKTKDDKWKKCFAALIEIDEDFIAILNNIPNKYGETTQVKNVKHKSTNDVNESGNSLIHCLDGEITDTFAKETDKQTEQSDDSHSAETVTNNSNSKDMNHGEKRCGAGLFLDWI